jgi:hypothetical protein
VHVQGVRAALRRLQAGVVDAVEEVLERAGHVADIRRQTVPLIAMPDRYAPHQAFRRNVTLDQRNSGATRSVDIP